MGEMSVGGMLMTMNSGMARRKEYLEQPTKDAFLEAKGTTNKHDKKGEMHRANKVKIA